MTTSIRILQIHQMDGRIDLRKYLIQPLWGWMRGLRMVSTRTGRECQGRRGVPVHLAAHTTTNLPRRMKRVPAGWKADWMDRTGMGCQGRRGVPVHLAAHTTTNYPRREKMVETVAVVHNPLDSPLLHLGLLRGMKSFQLEILMFHK